MKTGWVRAALAAALLCCRPGVTLADSFDFIQITYEANTGVWLRYGPVVERRDGLEITAPIPAYIANKDYTAQVLQFGSTDFSESYAQFFPLNKDAGFGSAFADTRTLEVGVASRNGAPSIAAAVSRAKLTIKNNHEDRSLDLLEYAFSIPEGSLDIEDFSEAFRNIRLHVHAFIDYRLKSPAGEFGGTWDETTGSLLDYFVLLEDAETAGGRPDLSASAQASVSAYSTAARHYHVDIDPYSGKLRLPSIPPLGELTVHYDMYAFVNLSAETLGNAFLGDPTNLTSDGSFALLLPQEEDDQPSVPEPASLLLLGTSALAVALRLRR